MIDHGMVLSAICFPIDSIFSLRFVCSCFGRRRSKVATVAFMHSLMGMSEVDAGEPCETGLSKAAQAVWKSSSGLFCRAGGLPPENRTTSNARLL